MSSTDVRITVCDDGSLCCGSTDSESTKECCRQGTGFLIVGGQVVKAAQASGSLSSPVSSTLPTSTPSVSSDSSNSGATAKASDSGDNKAVIIGAVLGSVVGVLLIVLAALFFRRRRSRSKTPPAEGPLNEVPDAAKPDTLKVADRPPIELEAEHHHVYIHEVDGERRM